MKVCSYILCMCALFCLSCGKQPSISAERVLQTFAECTGYNIPTDQSSLKFGYLSGREWTIYTYAKASNGIKYTWNWPVLRKIQKVHKNDLVFLATYIERLGATALWESNDTEYYRGNSMKGNNHLSIAINRALNSFVVVIEHY